MSVPAYAMPPPRFVFMEVNKRCNLRCKHCEYWTRDDDDKANYLPHERKKIILRDFAAMNDKGHVVICGGEPMLDLRDYFDLAGECRSLGLRALSVVNGTRIRTPAMAERMIKSGPHEISISLNSHRRELHDSTRGVDGAFDKAVRALRLLVEAKRKLRATDMKIYVMGLVYASNYREIANFYDFVLNDVHADKLKLNFLQPSFGQSGEIDPFFAKEGDVDPDELVKILHECNVRFALNYNPAWVEQVGMYFRSLRQIGDLSAGWHSAAGTIDHICNTYERNVMINHYGVARLCFSTGFPGKLLERPGDLRAFWEGADGIRARMRKCNQFCGISHSVRRESSTVEGNSKLAAHFQRFGLMRPPGMATEIVEGIRALVR